MLSLTIGLAPISAVSPSTVLVFSVNSDMPRAEHSGARVFVNFGLLVVRVDWSLLGGVPGALQSCIPRALCQCLPRTQWSLSRAQTRAWPRLFGRSVAVPHVEFVGLGLETDNFPSLIFPPCTVSVSASYLSRTDGKSVGLLNVSMNRKDAKEIKEPDAKRAKVEANMHLGRQLVEQSKAFKSLRLFFWPSSPDRVAFTRSIIFFSSILKLS